MAPVSSWPSVLRPGWLRPFRTIPDFLEPADLERLREELLASSYLAETTLNERFAGTYGFTVVFKAAGLERLRQHFPALAPYLARVLHPRCNAFYLNPLVIRRGARVAPHIDQSLRSWVSPLEPGFPVKVSVLYLQVPPGLQGGDLVLYRGGDQPLPPIHPRPNLLAEFRGTVRHEVTEVTGEELPPRVSLVCEQYRLRREVLDEVPDFAVKSKRPFADFLKDVLAPPPPSEPSGEEGPEVEPSGEEGRGVEPVEGDEPGPR